MRKLALVLALLAGSAAAEPLTALEADAAEKLCKRHKAEACLLAGRAFQNGEGRKVDGAKAQGYFEKACTLKSALGCEMAGIQLGQSSSPAALAKSQRLLGKACAAKSGNACFMLGLELAGAPGVTPNPGKAAAAYDKGCQYGSAPACTNLGGLTLAGSGVAKDPAKAVALLEKGCGKDSPNGCGMLGLIYLQGKVVSKDAAKGAAYLKQACDLGFQPACQK